ncbi:unnamed protein product [Linum tenue]|uniref:Cytochrome P450 n=1 Tax=Linum tenue TaxID=586396 RepID=A0AAV0IXA2_9ROSI|nr:unnamed protein product [Linum tenue]
MIGHIHHVGKVVPVSFQALAQRYGPLLTLRLGFSTCVLASDADVAQQIMKTHELNFSSRPPFGSPEHSIYPPGSGFAMVPYGDYWRFLRKLSTSRLLSVPQLRRFADVADDERLGLLRSLIYDRTARRPCDLGSELMKLTNNTICRMAMSTRCSGREKDATKIQEIVKAVLQLAVELSLGDTLGPFGKVLEYFAGKGKKLFGALSNFDELLERILKEHEEKLLLTVADGKTTAAPARKDVVDILLEIYNDPIAPIRLSKTDIKSFLLDIFIGGTVTTSSAMQWAMGELINHPNVLKKLRHEINEVVGSNRLVRESDVQNLPYLRAVICETLRLHPSSPMIMRECAEDCEINGFLIKAKTRVLLNHYAIMRDPKSWENPNEFFPERFLERLEEKNRNFGYIPFGMGRRACPGVSLAMMVMPTVVGALVQCFDWEINEGKLDLTVGSGAGAEMAHALVCYPVLRINPFDSSG